MPGMPSPACAASSKPVPGTNPNSSSAKTSPSHRADDLTYTTQRRGTHLAPDQPSHRDGLLPMMTATNLELADFDIDPTTGFLPSPDPLRILPAEFAAWDALGAELPALLLAHQARTRLAHMPLLDVDHLAGTAERERAMLLLSTLAGAYV